MDAEPCVISANSRLGAPYLRCTALAEEYAYAGRLRLQKGCRHAGHLACPCRALGQRMVNGSRRQVFQKRFHLPPADNRTPANSPSDRSRSYTGAGVDEGCSADRALRRSHIIDERRETGELLIRPGLLAIPRRF
jgi:hypothetical protein